MNDLVLGKKWTDRGVLQPITMILIAHPDHPNSRPISKNTNILQTIGIVLLLGHNEKIRSVDSQSSPNQTHRIISRNVDNLHAIVGDFLVPIP
jgi:hypothetical protein